MEIQSSFLEILYLTVLLGRVGILEVFFQNYFLFWAHSLHAYFFKGNSNEPMNQSTID